MIEVDMDAETLIDADSHFLPTLDVPRLRQEIEGLFEFATRRETDAFMDELLRVIVPKSHGGGFKAASDDGSGRPVSSGEALIYLSDIPGHSDAKDRASLLTETGFNMQVLIPDGVFSHMFLAPHVRDVGKDIRHALARCFNLGSSSAQQLLPEVFIGTCIVPGDDVDTSCRELDRAAQLGLRVVTLTGNWHGLNWDDEQLIPLWRKISELGMVVYVHHVPFSCRVSDHVPTTFTLGLERMRRMHISNYLGFAFEYMVGMASLTLGGVLESFPDLQFCFFESGGSWLPWAMYTLDHVFQVEPQCARCHTKPSELIMKHCLVAVEPDEASISDAVRSIGSQNYILGSDYPHPPSTYPNTVEGLRRLGLAETDASNILGRNMQRVLQAV